MEGVGEEGELVEFKLFGTLVDAKEEDEGSLCDKRGDRMEWSEKIGDPDGEGKDEDVEEVGPSDNAFDAARANSSLSFIHLVSALFFKYITNCLAACEAE